MVIWDWDRSVVYRRGRLSLLFDSGFDYMGMHGIGEDKSRVQEDEDEGGDGEMWGIRAPPIWG